MDLPEDAGTVFISYSHDSADHARVVLSLSNKLRSEGIDCVLDQYEASPPEGWHRWMDREISKAQFVLMVCTERYYRRVMGEEEPGVGLGIAWEGNLIYSHIYNNSSSNAKFLPIIFDQTDARYVPTPLKGATRYCMEGDYERLYSRLIGKPPVERPALGKRKSLPERKVKTNVAMPVSPPVDPDQWNQAETSSQPHWSIKEFKTPAGSFRKEGDVWIEHAPGHYNTFKELRQDDDYIYLVDPSRVKSGDINAPMVVRLPLRGGHGQWSYTNPIKWVSFTIVEPVTK
jgi:hypothetical protein